jgi:biotin carboxylase
VTDYKLLVVGMNLGLVHALERARVGRLRIFLLEEPSVLASHPDEYQSGSIAQIRAARYIFSSEATVAGIDWHQQEMFDAVIPGREYGVSAAAEIAARIGLLYPGPTAVEACTDKLRFRRTLDKADFPAPRYGEVHSTKDIDDFFGERPVVLKPRNRRGSLGVRMIPDRGQIADAWDESVQTGEGTHKPLDRELIFSYMEAYSAQCY